MKQEPAVLNLALGIRTKCAEVLEVGAVVHSASAGGFIWLLALHREISGVNPCLLSGRERL